MPWQKKKITLNLKLCNFALNPESAINMSTTTEQRIQRMQEKLQSALAPHALTIVDESAPHQGHAGAATGLGYFAITIGTKAFVGKGLVERHRLVYQALGDMMQTDIHALRIIIKKT